MKPQQIIDYELAAAVPHQYSFDDDMRFIGKQLISNPGKRAEYDYAE
jgi:hypothetical protein